MVGGGRGVEEGEYGKKHLDESGRERHIGTEIPKALEKTREQTELRIFKTELQMEKAALHREKTELHKEKTELTRVETESPGEKTELQMGTTVFQSATFATTKILSSSGENEAHCWTSQDAT